MEFGKIEIILGPMFSGKSTELMRRLRRNIIAKKKCVAIKYISDDRYSTENMATHDLLMMPAMSCSVLLKEVNGLLKYDVIGIDEGQFFPDITEACELLANKGKEVIVACLDGDFRRKPFGKVLELLPLAEEVTKLSAICILCGNDAFFTMKIGSNTEIVQIGGAELYKPVCRKCFFIKK